MRGNTGLVAVGLVSALLIGGCGTVVAGGSNGSGEPPVLHVGLDGIQGHGRGRESRQGSDPAPGATASMASCPRDRDALQTCPWCPPRTLPLSASAAALGLHAAARRHAHGWVVTAAGTILE